VTPYNPYLFVAITLFLAIVPFVQAGFPGVAIPPWVLFAVGILNIACATLLKMMSPGHDYDQRDAAPALSDADVDRLAKRGLELMRQRHRRAQP
jgi:hypothetical protein